MEIKNICIVGMGTMGADLAYVAAWKGFNVVAVDKEQKFIDKGLERIRGAVLTGIDKRKLTPQEGEALIQRIKSTLNLSEAAQSVELVIEAVYEDLEVKQEIFKKLDEAAPAKTILASNTSSLSITKIAEVTNRPEKVVGMHFFNPVPAMKLVEIVKGEKTGEDTIETVKDVAERFGKTTVVAKDAPGFIVNRVLGPILNESVKVLESGVASKEDIDKAMMLGANFPMGPLALADMVGLDIALATIQTLHRHLGEEYKPSDLLIELVKKGHLGMKTGQGFYKY